MEKRVSACIAVINAGSSSIKFAIYKSGAREAASFRGQVAGIGTSPSLTVRGSGGKIVVERNWPEDGFDHRSATDAILDAAVQLLGGTPVAAVGHRVVHGGTDFCEPVRIDDRVTGELRALCPLAPLHQPHNLAAIAAIAEGAPHIPQVACFDTAFHRSQPELAQMFALPRELTDSGLRRYGFHGLSYEYVSQRLVELWPALAGARVIVAHLGNGASLCALRAGRSIATTMGFTAVDGLVMGTRCGTIDPGILLYLMDERGLDARAVEDLIYRKSGLLGVSGISSDMRTLQVSDQPSARLAVDLFVYRVVREIGSLAAALGGLDALVFTGGIGENDPAVREAIAHGSEWLGIHLDHERNRLGEGLISSDRSMIPVWIVATDEERMIARHTSDVLALN
jgi:acetate kinase